MDDIDLGQRLIQWSFDEKTVPLTGRGEILHHFPKAGPRPADFEDLAETATGKPFLGTCGSTPIAPAVRLTNSTAILTGSGR